MVSRGRGLESEKMRMEGVEMGRMMLVVLATKIALVVVVEAAVTGNVVVVAVMMKPVGMATVLVVETVGARQGHQSPVCFEDQLEERNLLFIS